MPDATELLKTIKKAALDAIKAEKPADILFGKVTSMSPLQVIVEQKFILTKSQLVLTRNVTDFKTYITLTSEKKQITVHNGLVVGDEVVLIRKYGGQKFVITDRVAKKT